jgi:hypothetical protein
MIVACVSLLTIRLELANDIDTVTSASLCVHDAKLQLFTAGRDLTVLDEHVLGVVDDQGQTVVRRLIEHTLNKCAAVEGQLIDVHVNQNVVKHGEH